jgi:hypothetical protein
MVVLIAAGYTLIYAEVTNTSILDTINIFGSNTANAKSKKPKNG